MTYSYRTDEELYYGDFPTVEDAIVEGAYSMEDGQSLYVGEKRKYTAYQCVDPYAILDQAKEWAGEEVGEWSQDWLCDLAKDAAKMAELKKLVGDWIQANDSPTFYTVINVREITTSEILEALK